MLDHPLDTHALSSASTSEAVLAEQATRLGCSPFSPALQQSAEAAFVDYFERQPRERIVQQGTRMFESARRDTRLASPVRHVLLQTLDRGLSRVSSGYRLADAPLRKLAALDVWRATVSARVLDAMAHVASGRPPVPLSPSEQVLERKQQALLHRVCPEQNAALGALTTGSGVGPVRRDAAARVHRDGHAQTWQACFVQHLQRVLFLTLDATLSASDVDNLLLFLTTPAGKTCLATRALWGACDASVEGPPVAPDPPEMAELQATMAEMIDEAAGTDPTERSAYYTELAERMSERLHAGF